MKQSDPTSRRPGLWTALAATAVAGASAVTIAMPPNMATADPVPPSPTTAAPAAPAPPPPPADPNAPPPAQPAPPPPPADPNAPPPAPADPNAPAPADPNAPPAAPAADPGRVENASGGFSYVLPAGWEVADASRLSYGQALLLKQTGLPGQPATTAT